MKILGITQRIDDITEYIEKRDALDQRWINLLCQCGYFPIIFPNNIDVIEKYLDKFHFSGFILSGGNNLTIHGGNSQKRDEVENVLIKYSINKQLPLLGICRGMQMIQYFFDTELKKIEGHINIKHPITINSKKIIVNSYHQYGATSSSKDLKILALSEDGVIEAIKHKKFNLYGIMWHPERNNIFLDFDLNLIKQIFG